MTDLLYPALTPDQRIHAAWLFADESFGVESAGYVYEADKQGEITGRRPLVMSDPVKGGRRPQIRSRIAVCVEPHVTAEMQRNALAAIDALADAIVKQSIQIHQEVTV